MPRQLSEAEVREKIRARGFELSGPYHGTRTPVAFRCLEHGETHNAYPTSLLHKSVGGLRCCGLAKVAAFGKTNRLLTAEAERRMRDAGFEPLEPYETHLTKILIRCTTHGREERIAPKGILQGQRMKCCKAADTSMQFGGKSRRAETIHKKMLNGVTAGQPGWFYVARLADGSLKFGSSVRMNPAARMKRLRHEMGMDCQLVLAAAVPDAGAYEAAMMEAHRPHWISGERFRDFLTPPTAAASG